MIKTEFKKFFDYQGASFFIWDSYSNRFNLIATTDDSVDINNAKYSYSKGYGSTGWVGARGLPIITDNIGDKYKWYEGENDIDSPKPKTSMIIPIKKPTNQEEVIGIMRFLNKRNRCNPDIIDYFNNIDLKMVLSYSKYLALTISFCIKNDEQVDTISKIAHEFKTPANAISKCATRLLEKIKDNDQETLNKNLKKYLTNIADFAEIQLWQADTFLFSTRKQHEKTKYCIQECSLNQILEKSKAVTRPIARQEGVECDNIEIHNQIGDDIFLRVDEKAFEIVFYNLLTNAVKYHDHEYPDSFHVDIFYTKSDVAVEIIIEDYGIGMEKKDKESIFQVGYRGERALRENISGFGIGLSIVQQIITDFGGAISVKKNQKPTSFEILLPKTLIS